MWTVACARLDPRQRPSCSCWDCRCQGVGVKTTHFASPAFAHILSLGRCVLRPPVGSVRIWAPDIEKPREWRFQRKFWTQLIHCGNPLIFLQWKVAVPLPHAGHWLSRRCFQGPVHGGNSSQPFVHRHDDPGVRACTNVPWLGKDLGALME